MISAWNLLAAAGPDAAHHISEKDLGMPDFTTVSFLGMSGWNLLAIGLAVFALGLLFGLVALSQVKRLPLHQSMKDISELIYETCKTYLGTQAKFIGVLWAFIAAIMVVYFGVLQETPVVKVLTIV